MRKDRLCTVSIVAATACIIHASDARADVTSWLSVGGGYAVQRNAVRDATDNAGVMSLAVGAGSSPLSTMVVGGLFRSTTYFGLGTDLNLSVRFATGGFARGDWGAAIDLGPTFRGWGGGDSGRFPLHGMLILGAPWGLELGVGGNAWNIGGEPFARGAVALLEIDLLRLTVTRQGSTDSYWRNPSPAGGRMPSPRSSEPSP